MSTPLGGWVRTRQEAIALPDGAVLAHPEEFLPSVSVKHVGGWTETGKIDDFVVCPSLPGQYIHQFPMGGEQ